jgi:hypothetical protein
MPSSYVRAAFLLAASSLVSSAPIPQQHSVTSLFSERYPTESTTLLKNSISSVGFSQSDSRSYGLRESLVTDVPKTAKLFKIDNILMIEKEGHSQRYGPGKLFYDQATGKLTLSKLGPDGAEKMTQFDLKDCAVSYMPADDYFERSVFLEWKGMPIKYPLPDL